MAFKAVYYGADTVGAVDDFDNTLIIANQSGSEPWDDHDLTMVDGQLTVITNTDDLCQVRFLVIPEALTTSDLTAAYPAAEDSMVWYSFFSGQGPLVFRLVSKRTVHPDHQLWIQIIKRSGTLSTTARWGLNLMIQASA